MLIEHYITDLDEAEIDFDSISINKTIEEIRSDLTKMLKKEPEIPPNLYQVNNDILKTIYIRNNETFNQKCAFEEYYKNNPDYRGALGLYCSCPKCSPMATTSAIKTTNPVSSISAATISKAS